jgi:peptidyl-prolyl cis-trans isomerase C
MHPTGNLVSVVKLEHTILMLRWTCRALTLLAALPLPVAAADIVAHVNGTPITRKAMTDVVEGSLALDKRRPQDNDRRRLEAAALDSLIDLELLYQASVARQLAVTDAELDRELERNRKRFPDARSFADALAVKGMTLEDLRQDTRKMMEVNKYLERVVWRDIDISAEDVAKFYQTHRDEFRRPEQVRASHILLRLPANASDDLHRAQRAKALDFLEQLRDGADFATLAREHSEDRATAKQGGDLGFFSRGTMVDEFEEQVFPLLPGQTTPVFETTYGIHIAKVTDRRVAGTRTLDEVRDTIRDLLAQRERERLQAAHVEQLRRQATIEIEDPALAPARE